MENREYIFQIREYDVEMLIPQVGQAIDKGVELSSRKSYPERWEKIDKLNARTAKKVEKNAWQKPISMAFYIAFVVLGGGILIMMRTLRVIETPELTVLRYAGIFLLICGMVGLWACISIKPKKKIRYKKAARRLLDNMGKGLTEESAGVLFSECGIVLPKEDGDAEVVPYENVEYVIENEDIFFVAFDRRVSILQKKDLVTENVDAFRMFILEKIAVYHLIE